MVSLNTIHTKILKITVSNTIQLKEHSTRQNYNQYYACHDKIKVTLRNIKVPTLWTPTYQLVDIALCFFAASYRAT